MRFHSLDQLLPRDHRARIVWRFVEGLDLEPFYGEIRVSDAQAGRTAIAPEVLLSLWLLATLDGISSGRELDRRTETDLPYLWICGGVQVNYHTLCDFRVQHGEKLDQILTETVAALIHQDLVQLEEIGQDGMRVRASAGSSSFRRRPTLEQLHQEAKRLVEEQKQRRESQGPERAEHDARRQAARERAAREREERIGAALREREELARQREQRKSGAGDQTRVSTTDPQARTMKMGDGGFRPAHNVQFATAGEARVIVAVDITNEGTDGNQLGPMLEQVKARYGKAPRTVLVDSAFATRSSVEQAEANGTQVLSSIPRASQIAGNGKDPHARNHRDSDHYAAFRARMAEPEHRERYKQRPSIAEFPNADCRNRGLRQFLVRGLEKGKAVALWHALAFNLLRMINLKAIP
jgi:transposase